MSAVHARALSEFDNFGMVHKQPSIDGRSVATVTNKVPYALQLEPSPLQLPTMHSSSSPAFSFVPRPHGPGPSPLRLSKYTRTFNFREIFMRI